MSVRQAVTTWLAAAVIVACLLLVPPPLYAPSRPVPKADLVVIGSSLTAHAVPYVGSGTGSLLGDGRSHIRLAKAGINERDTLAYIEQALDNRPALVLVEINPLIVDRADSRGHRPCDSLPRLALDILRQRRGAVEDIYRNWRGRPVRGFYTADIEAQSVPRHIDPLEIARSYPFEVRQPCEPERLDALAARAKAQRSRLVFMLPPRSPYGNAQAGAAGRAALDAAAQRIVARLGAPLFSPQAGWRNEEFVDHAHLNLQGRKHFVAALRRWWATAA